jgi:hypothetical protein
MYMFNIRQTKNQGARRPRGSKSVQRSLAGRAGAAGTRVPPGAGCEKKTQIQLGLAKKMPILWYFHGEDSVIELDFLRD